jgi:TRAP-type C4-dicarboxylate transport system permease small subunit
MDSAGMKIRDRMFMFADRLQRLQLWLAAVALLILMGVTVVDVFLRYLFNRPVRGSYDLVESMLLVFVFNAIAAAFFGRRHIVIDLIDSALSGRATAVLIRAADVLSVLCVGLIMWAMLIPMTQAYHYGDSKLELHLPIYILWVVALVGLAGTLFCALVALLAQPATVDTGHSE